jgi:hypothetical protein
MTATTSLDSLPALIERSGLWPMRVVWFVQPLLVGSGLLDAVGDRSAPVRLVIEIGSWLVWFVGMVSVMAPSTVTLTLLRIVAPAAIVAPLGAALLAGSVSNSVLVAIGAGALANAIAFLPSTGDPMINGSAYGSERRMALRPPASVLVGPIYAVWAIVAAGTFGGPLLLASRQWILGVPLTVIGAAFVFLGVRSLHQLSRRWIVFVPAGFVIHDFWLLAESLLVQRSIRPSLGPAEAPAPDGTVDLTAGARGLALAIRVDEPLPTALRTRRSVEATTGTEFWFTPSLPGKVLTEARARAITIR